MNRWATGFGYFAALTLAVTGFMFGSAMFFAVALWALAWMPVLFWVLLPFLILVAALEFFVFASMVDYIRDGAPVSSRWILGGLHILVSSAWVSFTTWHLGYSLIGLFFTQIVQAKRRASLSGTPVAYRFSLKPFQEQVNRGFRGMSH